MPLAAKKIEKPLCFQIVSLSSVLNPGIAS